MQDEIMKEVHAIRERIAEECGFDLHRMFLRERRVQEEWKGKVVTKEELAKSRRVAAREA